MNIPDTGERGEQVKKIPVDPSGACIDCTASRTPSPQPRTARSQRCPAHQQEWQNHLSQRRNRLARRRRNPSLPAVPSAQTWAKTYEPRRLHKTDDEATLVVLQADDVVRIVDAIETLTHATAQARTARQATDPSATRRALRALLKASDEACASLENIPGIHA